MYNTYLFDFDGTLVDSMPFYGATMLRILNENSISYPVDVIKIITPLGYSGTADYFIKLGMNMRKEEIVAIIIKYLSEVYANIIPAKDNVIQVLRQLKARGASLNVLTASPHIMLDPCLKRLGVFDLFDYVWSCDDFGTTKADPNIYKLAASKIGVTEKDVLFLDDNYNADKTAVSVGMRICGVYDPSSDEYVEQMKGICDHYIYDFSELLNL